MGSEYPQICEKWVQWAMGDTIKQTSGIEIVCCRDPATFIGGRMSARESTDFKSQVLNLGFYSYKREIFLVLISTISKVLALN